MNEPTIRDINAFLLRSGADPVNGFNDKRKDGLRRIKLMIRLQAIQQVHLQHWLDVTYPHLHCKVYTYSWKATYCRVTGTCIRIEPKA